MNKRFLIIVPLIILLVTFITWLWMSPAGISQAPNIKLTTTDGTNIDLKQLRGKPVLITFWATSCVGCVREMPHLITLYNELASDGLEIIGIAMPYDPPNQVIRMVAEKQIPYPIAIDIKGNAVLAFGDILVTPTSFLIAPDGTIAKHKIGELDMHELRSTIISMLPAQNKTSDIRPLATPTS